MRLPLQGTSLSLFLIAILGFTPYVGAKYNPDENYIESEAVQARYPEPDEAITSPAFTHPKTDFTSQAEMETFIDEILAINPLVRHRILGLSQNGRKLHALIFTQEGIATPAVINRNGKPTLLLIAQQHGNETAAGEAALAYAYSLASGKEGDILAKLNLIIMPRANPDGAEEYERDLANGFNLNRDHLLLTTPEGKALATFFNEYQPDVVLDSHEFSVAGRWITKFGGLQLPDGAIQYSTIAHQYSGIVPFSEQPFKHELLSAFDKAGLKHDWYFTSSSTNNEDKTIAMGGINADIGRNVSGLRNSISFLLETRGFGLGQGNFKRRVYTHLVAIRSIADTTVTHAKLVLDNHRAFNQAVIDSAGKGEIIVLSKAAAEQREVSFVDETTGELITHLVDWRSALTIEPLLTRARPYGYLLAPTETEAAARLRLLGLEVYKLTTPTTVDLEAYAVKEAKGGVKFDVTGAIGKAGNEMVEVKTELVPLQLVADESYYYVPLAQPLANLAVAAMEPESQSSYLANNIFVFPQVSNKERLPFYRLMQATYLPLVLWEAPTDIHVKAN